MGDRMLAATLKAYGKPLEIGMVARPEPASEQILIKLEASGVCHTDVHVWKGGLKPAANPSPEPGNCARHRRVNGNPAGGHCE